MTALSNASLRSRAEDDERFLLSLFHEVRAHEFLPLGLPATALGQLLTMQFRAQNVSYAVQFPHADDDIVCNGQEPIGRLLVDRSENAIQLIDIALLPTFRGHGLGTRLISELIVEAGKRGVPLRLHVCGGNPAARLYERLGFVSTGGDGLSMAMEVWPRADLQTDIKVDEPLAAATGPVEPSTTSPYFHTLIGQTLPASTTDGQESSLQLDAVQSLSVKVSEKKIKSDSFSLKFSGPMESALPSGIITITSAGDQKMEIFMTPLGPRNARMTYEAVFNRMTREELM